MRIHLLLLIILLACNFAAAAESGDDEWQFELTPYVWLPTISGDLNFDPPPGGGGNGGPSIDVGPSDWLDLLNGAALINGGARKGRFSVTADFVYLSLKSDGDKVVAVREAVNVPVDASLNLMTQTKFEGGSWTLAGGYTVKNTDRTTLDIIAGVRYLGLDVKTSWNLELDITAPGGGVVLPAQGSREKGVDLWDGIIGIRGNTTLGNKRWSLPYYLDIGTGSSDLTWQALAGVSYRYDWGDLMLVYRHLDYDEGSDEFLRNLSLSGPAFGARFRF